MTEQAQGGWNEDKTYTVIKNVTKNSKIVLSMLKGIEVYPGQALDLRTCFQKSEVQNAGHEIASLIRSGHLQDIGEGAEGRQLSSASSGMPSAAEMAKKIKEAKLREISDSSSLSQLEDWMADKDADIAKSAKLRSEILLGLRQEDGTPIPGAETEEAKPTELIRSTGNPEPVVAGVVSRAS